MNQADSELMRLIAATRDETISPEELARLEELLLEDPEARQLYLRHMQMRSLLETFPPEADDQALEDALSGDKLVRVSLPRSTLALAAAALAAFLIIIGSLLIGPTNSAPKVATLIFAEDCQWKHPAAGLVEGERLPAGKIRLSSGTALIRFDGGAEMVISGESSVELISAEAGSLDKGEVVVRAEQGSEGFRLQTPDGEMVDLGTEFAVRVDPKSGTELHVLEGEVGTEDSIVSAGHAVRLGKDKAPVAFGAPSFKDVIRKANPKERRDLMTAYEGFFLEEGIYHPTDVVKGNGWAGPWRLRTEEEMGKHPENTAQQMEIGYAQMEVPWPVRGGRMGMLKLPAGMSVWLRPMKTPIDLSKDGVTYLSFMAAEAEVDPTADPANRATDEKWAKRDDFRITLRSSRDYFGESVSFGWAKRRQPRVQASPGSAIRSIREIPQGETVFCVAKITRAKTGPDEIRFRFYRTSDTLHFVEPATWDVVVTDRDLSASLDLVLITAQGLTTRYVDELRFGPTWRSVTPIDTGNLN